MKKDYTLSVATLNDAQAIQYLLYPEYFEETAYAGLEYDPVMTAAQILNWIENNFCFIARDGSRVVGLASMQLTRTFYTAIEADVEMFIVAKDYRGTGVSRDLVNAIVQNADANGAKIIYSSCLSGINQKNNSLFTNLWKKYGFKELGTVLIRG